MITSLALFVAMQASNPVTELIDPTAKFVSVQAIVKLPQLSGHEMAEAKILAEIMADEVSGYGRSEMRDIAARAGESLRITLMPDHIRIQIGVLSSDLKPAIAYIDQILRYSRLSADSINKAMAEIPFRSQSLWASALQPYKYKFERIKRDEIVELYHRLCRPEAVWLTVGGPIEEGVADAYWAAKVKDWNPGKMPPRSLDQAQAIALTELPGRESMIELRSKEITASDSAMTSKLLAVIALGCGKGSAMFERLRDQQAWSYRQEGLLWPTTNGFVPRFIMASGDKMPPVELGKAMRDQLTDAVQKWTEADVDRARGMAEGILRRGLQMSPLYFNLGFPVSDSLHDRTFMEAYWQMKTGRPWGPAKLLGEMALLKVDEVREVALGLLASSEIHVIAARG
jgi:hypothetical protein